MEDVNYLFTKKLIHLCLFLVPALLLCTKNGSVYVIAILALYSLFFIIKHRKNVPRSKFNFFIIAILTAYFIANIPVYLADGIDNLRYFKGASRYIACIPIYFCIKTVLKETNNSRQFFEQGIIVGSIGALAIALYQTFVEGRPRVDGFLYSINFGYLACSLAFLALTLAKNSQYRYFLYIAFSMSIYSTILTLTRGAIFAIPILLVLTFIFYDKKNKVRRTLITLVSLAVISVGLFTISPNLKQRVIETNEDVANISSGITSTGIRVELWYAATKAFFDNPLVGSSYTERENINQERYKQGLMHKESAFVQRGHAHNQYFEMMASNGIWGILAFVVMLFAPIFYFFRNINTSIYAYSGFIFVTGFSIFCLTEVPLEQNLIASFYGFLVPILIAFTEIDKTKKQAAL